MLQSPVGCHSLETMRNCLTSDVEEICLCKKISLATQWKRKPAVSTFHLIIFYGKLIRIHKSYTSITHGATLAWILGEIFSSSADTFFPFVPQQEANSVCLLFAGQVQQGAVVWRVSCYNKILHIFTRYFHDTTRTFLCQYLILIFLFYFWCGIRILLYEWPLHVTDRHLISCCCKKKRDGSD